MTLEGTKVSIQGRSFFPAGGPSKETVDPVGVRWSRSWNTQNEGMVGCVNKFVRLMWKGPLGVPWRKRTMMTEDVGDEQVRQGPRWGHTGRTIHNRRKGLGGRDPTLKYTENSTTPTVDR